MTMTFVARRGGGDGPRSPTRGSGLGRVGDKGCAAPRAGARYVLRAMRACTVELMFCAALCETAVSGTREGTNSQLKRSATFRFCAMFCARARAFKLRKLRARRRWRQAQTRRLKPPLSPFFLHFFPILFTFVRPACSLLNAQQWARFSSLSVVC